MIDSIAGRRILVVEDEYPIAMLLEDMLADLGCIVAGIATTKADAFGLIGSTEFEAAVLDVSISGSDSFDVASALRDRQIPFVFATGHGASRIVPEFAAYPVLQKPFFLDDLSKALHALLCADEKPQYSR